MDPSLRDLLAEADAAYFEAMTYHARVDFPSDAALLKLLYSNDLYMRALRNVVDPSTRASIREKSSALLRNAAEHSGAPSQLAQTRDGSRAHAAGSLVHGAAFSSGGGSAAPVDAVAPGTAMRKGKIRELFAAEKKFCGILEVFAEKVIAPLNPRNVSGHWAWLPFLRRQPLSEEEHRLMFSTIEQQVLPLHRQLLQDLEKAVDDPRASIGDIFIYFAHSFKLHVEGIERALNIPQLLTDLSKEDEELAEFLDATSSKEVGMPFFDVLTLPFQHMCKYPDIIDSIKKYTNPAHPDFKALSAAREKVLCSEGPLWKHSSHHCTFFRGVAGDDVACAAQRVSQDL